nr:immunoglobulin light chain junction region [Macaca mulatta]MOW06331.1 immunoglobulin light chain junction region [Macaca mulatta]MOW06641.1 immunoglobulin light chain junction region [Macaca mulatta]MOW06759.1 immunoglobulin light chain junction region [Macaca mulatta]MOW06763.1 immunoglobulin light chain junction region [Macaca mulatta]
DYYCQVWDSSSKYVF